MAVQREQLSLLRQVFRNPVEPRPLAFKLSGEPEERGLGARPGRKVHAHGEPGSVPMQGHRHCRLPVDVENRRPGQEFECPGGNAVEGFGRLDEVAGPQRAQQAELKVFEPARGQGADPWWRRGDGGSYQDVVVGEESPDGLAAPLEEAERACQLPGGNRLRDEAEGPGQWFHFAPAGRPPEIVRQVVELGAYFPGDHVHEGSRKRLAIEAGRGFGDTVAELLQQRDRIGHRVCAVRVGIA